MRGKTLVMCMVVAVLSSPASLRADTVDDLVAAALSGDETRTEAASRAALADKDFPFPKACVKVGELSGQFDKAEKKRQDLITTAIRVMLNMIVAKSGDREIPIVAPKLIEVINKGVTPVNLLVEAAISDLCIHGFSDADYKAQATKIDDWDDHKKMWTQWWSVNGSKPYMALVIGGFARAGAKLDAGDMSDTALDSMIQVLINALTHDLLYIRSNAARLLSTRCFRDTKINWGFDAEAPQADRQKSVEEARSVYNENKDAVYRTIRGK